MHVCTHITFFIVLQFMIDTKEEKPDWPQEYIDNYHAFVSSVLLLKWGHLVMFITQISVLYLKRYEKYNFAQALMVLVMPFAVAYPMIHAVFVFRVYSIDAVDFHGIPTQMTMWLIIEIGYMIWWIFSLMLFLFFANILKYKSIRKKHFDDEYVFNN